MLPYPSGVVPPVGRNLRHGASWRYGPELTSSLPDRRTPGARTSSIAQGVNAGDAEGGRLAGKQRDEAVVDDGRGVDLVDEQGEVAQQHLCCHGHLGDRPPVSRHVRRCARCGGSRLSRGSAGNHSPSRAERLGDDELGGGSSSHSHVIRDIDESRAPGGARVTGSCAEASTCPSKWRRVSTASPCHGTSVSLTEHRGQGAVARLEGRPGAARRRCCRAK